MILNTKVLEDGYILLNEIGEKIRGEQILYSVTITATGNSIISSGSGEVITLQLPLQTFLKDYVYFSHSRMTVRTDYSSLKKMIDSQIKDNTLKENQYEIWGEEKISIYRLFDSQTRNARNQHLDSMSEGQMLEAFLRFGAEAVEETSSQEYWQRLIDNARESKGQKPFWAGGDISNIQVKGLEASITNINTLINAISRTLDILRKNKIGADAIDPYVKKHFMSKINNKANDTIEDTQKNLIAMFTEDIASKVPVKFDF